MLELRKCSKLSVCLLQETVFLQTARSFPSAKGCLRFVSNFVPSLETEAPTSHSALATALSNRRRRAMKLPENTMIVSRFAAKVKGGAANRESNASAKQTSWLVSMMFEYQRTPESRSKLICMRRPADDSFSSTVERLKKKIVQRSLEMMSLDVSGAVDISLDGASSAKFKGQSNEDVLYNESIASMSLDGKSYRIVRDPPDCNNLKLMLRPRVGCPLFPSYDLEIGRKEPPYASFYWYTGPAVSPLPAPVLSSEGGSPKYILDGLEFRHSGPSFVPQEADIAKRVYVLLDLGPDTIVYCAISDHSVADCYDEPLIFEERQQKYCQNRCSDGLRIMSYNVLANLYLNLDLKQEELFFPYCPKEYQEYPYRYPILLKEIPGYNADLIFLQEVDERFQRRFLPNWMSEWGYRTCFRRKGLVVNEGLAICFREDKLKLIDVYDMWLTDLLDSETYPENSDILKMLEQDEELKSRMLSRPCVVQLASLSLLSNEEVIFVIGNTHLHYHPLEENIKVLQALIGARFIARITQSLSKKFPNARIYQMFAGDFNSTPNGSSCGVYELLSTGTISGSHMSWRSTATQGNKNLSKFLAENTFSDGLGCMSSLALDPPYTNYTRHLRKDVERGFAGCLDYIWGCPSLKVSSVVPMPSEELVTKYVALPSKISASDHLPLICDIQVPYESTD